MFIRKLRELCCYWSAERTVLLLVRRQTCYLSVFFFLFMNIFSIRKSWRGRNEKSGSGHPGFQMGKDQSFLVRLGARDRNAETERRSEVEREGERLREKE